MNEQASTEMTDDEAISVLEGKVIAPDRYFEAIQHLINTGLAWKACDFSYEEAAKRALRQGRVMLGPRSRTDRRGREMPRRSEVVEGAPGSYEFVVTNIGKERADCLASMDSHMGGRLVNCPNCKGTGMVLPPNDDPGEDDHWAPFTGPEIDCPTCVGTGKLSQGEKREYKEGEDHSDRICIITNLEL